MKLMKCFENKGAITEEIDVAYVMICVFWLPASVTEVTIFS